LNQLLLASNNPGKLREMQALLQQGDWQLPIELVTPRQIGLALDVAENGSTYAANAALKAVAFAKASGLTAMADDSGLEVEALGGAPGIYSARYAPQERATDADRRAYLLAQLVSHPRPWPARFCCTIAIARPDGLLEMAEGFCGGEIIPHEYGNDGFGYDPIFWLPERQRSMAQLTMEEKNRISHRAHAVQAALPILRRLLELHQDT